MNASKQYILIILLSATITFLFSLAFISKIGLAQLQFKQDLANMMAQSPFLVVAYSKINIQEAWDFVTSLNVDPSPVVVGIIDTGLDEPHPEFSGVITHAGKVGRVELGNTPAEARSDTFPGGHGTQVAGIIGANNLLGLGINIPSSSPQMNGVLSGIDGVDYTLEMRTLKTGSLYDFVRNVRSIHKSGGRIINFSQAWVKSAALTESQKEVVTGQLGPISFSKYNLAVPLVLDFYSDVLFIVSAGNENIDAVNVIPANAEKENVVTVAATNLDDTRQVNSNFGSNIDVAAPGLSIYAPRPGGIYDTDFGGTSGATAMITGVAAILKSIDPDSSPAKIKESIAALSK